MSSISIAMARGTRCARRSTPPASATKPRFTSESHILASGQATIMSAASANSNPPPTAMPLIAAMTGLSRSNSSVSPANPPSPHSSGSPSAAAFMSHPAEKNFSPAPVMIATRRSGSSRNAPNVWDISIDVAESIALAFGRSIVTSRTWSRASVRMPVPMFDLTPLGAAR